MTLAALLQERFGIPQRTTWIAAAALIAIGAVAFLLFRPRYDGLDKVAYDGKPTFNVLAPPTAHRVRTGPGELLRLRAKDIYITVRPLTLPPYTGAASGVLPVYATNHARPQAETGEARLTLDGAPGYAIKTAHTIDLYAVPKDGDRTGVVVTYEHARPGHQALAGAMRSVLRSLQFGTGRS